MSQRKCAVYCLSRALYESVLPSLKSLLLHTNVDHVYLLIEDDTLPFALPRVCQCINVGRQPYFRHDGPNYKNRWTWMVLMRAALAHILPQEDTVLSLDADTIIIDDISGAWDTPLDGCYWAGAKEPKKSRDDFYYANAGVALFNLQALRDGKADEIIAELNAKWHPYPEQDVLNDLCQGHIAELPSDYNATYFTEPAQTPKIVHLAARPNWHDEPIVKAFETIPWEETMWGV